MITLVIVLLIDIIGLLLWKGRQYREYIEELEDKIEETEWLISQY